MTDRAAPGLLGPKDPQTGRSKVMLTAQKAAVRSVARWRSQATISVGPTFLMPVMILGTSLALAGIPARGDEPANASAPDTSGKPGNPKSPIRIVVSGRPLDHHQRRQGSLGSGTATRAGTDI
jgi:hypothetical protein